MVVSYTDLAYFDDLLVDCFLDRLYYWAKTRKVREYKPVRGISQETLLDIVQSGVIQGDYPLARCVDKFINIASVQAFLRRFQNPSTRHEFERHLRRYLSIYHVDCGFEIEVTDRYIQRSNTVEACVISRKSFEPDEQIKYLAGYLSKLNEHEEAELNKGKDFSIINSTRRGANCLMLGPARFVNHDCSANARFVSNSKNMYVYAKRKIEIGEEITVEYSKNYFGRKNKECLCATCEKQSRNGFFKGDVPDESESEAEPEEGQTSSPSSLRSRSQSVTPEEAETPTTSVEPDLHFSNSERESEEPYDWFRRERILRPRKSIDLSRKALKVVPIEVPQLTRNDILMRLKEFQRLYNSSPFETASGAADCENCRVPFIRQIEVDFATRHLLKRFCPRCDRHARLYNVHWPRTAMPILDEDEEEPGPIELYRDPNQPMSVSSSEDESEMDARPRRHKREKWKPLPAVADEDFVHKVEPRRLSLWQMRRMQFTGFSPESAKTTPVSETESPILSPSVSPPRKLRLSVSMPLRMSEVKKKLTERAAVAKANRNSISGTRRLSRAAARSAVYRY